MHRRRFLGRVGTALGVLGGGPGTTAAVATATQSADSPPGIAWHRTYDGLDVGAVAPAHGGGHVLVNHGQSDVPDHPLLPLRVALLDGSGAVLRRRELDVPGDARRARVDVVRTADGYAVAVGTWFATLREDLTVRTSGYASDLFSGQNTEVARTTDGVVVANDGTGVRHSRRTTVVGFGADGDRRWTWEYLGAVSGESASAVLHFLRDHPDGGVVVGGYRQDVGHPWLAHLAPDGTEHWKATVTDVDGRAFDATADADGVTLLTTDGLVRLDWERAIAWQRSYDEFDEPGGVLSRTPDGGERTGGSRASSDGTSDGGERTDGSRPSSGGPPDGGYVFPASYDRDRVFGLARTDAAGQLQWHRQYANPIESLGSPDAVYTDLVERAPGEYLLVGYRETTPDGWAMLLSESVEPGPSPTPEPTMSGPSSSTPTATSEPTPPSTPTDETSGRIPGFGVGPAVAGAAGVAGWLARRR